MKALPWITTVILAVLCALLFYTARDSAKRFNETSIKYVAAVAQLEKANATITAQAEELKRTTSARRVPIKLSLRKSALGSGSVLELHNTSGKDIPVLAKLSNETFPDGKQFNLVINAGAFKEIGVLQGWSVAPGDVVELSSAGYDPTKTSIH